MVSLIVISDCHLQDEGSGAIHGVDTGKSFAEVLEFALDAVPRPDLIVGTGDISHDGSGHSYSTYVKLLSRSGADFCWLRGNHDDPTAMREFGASLLQKESIELGGWQLMLLDSCLDGEVRGELSGNRLERLGSMLEDSTGPVLIFLHHPPLPMSSAWLDRHGLENGAELVALVRRSANVKGVFFGHVHQEYETMIDGVGYYATPSSCFQFRPLSETFELDDRRPGYRWIELEEDGCLSTGVERLAAPAGCR